MSPFRFRILLVLCVAIQQVVGGISCCCFSERLLVELRAVVGVFADVGGVVGGSEPESKRACCRRVDGEKGAVSVGRDFRCGGELKSRVLAGRCSGVIRTGCDCDASDLVVVSSLESQGRISIRQDRFEVFWGSVVVGSIGLSVDWIREGGWKPKLRDSCILSASSSQCCAALSRWVC